MRPSIATHVVARELEIKTGRLAGMLEELGLDGVLLNSQHNFAWLTCGASNGIDHSRDNGAATLLVTAKGGRFVLANNIEMARILAEQISPEHFQLVEYSWQEEKAEPAVTFLKAREIAGANIGADIPVDSAPNVEGAISRCRLQLTSDEIERFRVLGKDASSAMDTIADQIVPGEREWDIAEKLRAELGARGMTSVVTLVGADERITNYRHPVPTMDRWRKVVLLVTCAKREGLIVSLSRMISSGPIADELKRRTEACAFVNSALWHATRPGVTGSQLYLAAAEAYERAGFPGEIDKHHQGGAAGYRTREWVAHPGSRDVVQPDQAFAWNPSITSTKVEETVIVTGRDGVIETITSSAKFPQIPVELDGITYLSPGVLSL